MADGLKHIDVTAGRITEDQYEAETQHELDSGVEGDFIYWDTASASFKRIAHASDLDAHTRNIQELYRVGELYPSPYVQNAEYQNTVLLQDRLEAAPFPVTRDITVDRIGVQVTTLEGGKNARLGIYNNGVNLYPGTLLLDAGTVSVATTGIKLITLAPGQALTKGLYWLVLISDATGTAAVRFAYANSNILGVNVATLYKGQGGWYVASAYGALPDPYPGGGSMREQKGLLAVLRIESLD